MFSKVHAFGFSVYLLMHIQWKANCRVTLVSHSILGLTLQERKGRQGGAGGISRVKPASIAACVCARSFPPQKEWNVPFICPLNRQTKCFKHSRLCLQSWQRLHWDSLFPHNVISNLTRDSLLTTNVRCVGFLNLMNEQADQTSVCVANTPRCSC